MTLGDLLKQYREDNKISMDEFSKRSTLSKGYISMLENNINPRNNKPIAPTLPTIQKIALGMSIDVDSILKALDGNQSISLENDDDIHLDVSQDKRMSLCSRIRQRRESLNMSRSELAYKIGVTSSAVANYENGISSPKIDVMYRLFDALQCDANYLYQDEMNNLSELVVSIKEQEIIEKYRALDDIGRNHIDSVFDWELSQLTLKNELMQTISQKDAQLKEQAVRISELEGNNSEDAQKRLSRLVPYYQKLASAGVGQILWDDLPPDEMEIPDTYETRLGDYALGVNGDSMEPIFWDCDIVLVQKVNDLAIGEVGIFILDGQCYLKELGYRKLISKNPDYAPIIIEDNSDFACVGKVLCNLTPHSNHEIAYMYQRRERMAKKSRENVGDALLDEIMQQKTKEESSKHR